MTPIESKGPGRAMRIYCDLDEVITDFVGGACDRFGVPLNLLRNNWPKGIWGIEEPMRVAHKITYPNDLELVRPQQFWRRLADASFWAKLEKHVWADRLISLLQDTDPHFMFLTSPTRAPGSWYGKVIWLKHQFGDEFDRFMITPHKHLLSHREAILIDDRESNITNWERDGGLGILFPAHHNRLHAVAESNYQLEYVAQQLKAKVFSITMKEGRQ